ncbi:MAG: hypothetical protein P8M64_02905, partial [Thermodesulfobacteriota bacteirum]|nr:hypothetical protein [Thermodesulfobacteriota bacterium]
MVEDKTFKLNSIDVIIPTTTKEKNLKLSERLKREYGNLEIINEISSSLKIKSFLDTKKIRFKNLIVFGLGGSSLGTKATFEALRFPKNPKTVYIIDNLDSDNFERIFKEIAIRESIFMFISKSGETFEIKNLLKETVKRIVAKNIKLSQRLIFITEENKSYLNRFGKKNAIPTYQVNKNLGGRFSVLSKSTFLPCELINLNWKKILSGAFNCYNELSNKDFILINNLVEFYYRNYLKGKKITVMMPYTESLISFSEWFMQLWGESLGKIKSDGSNIGLTPIKYLGPKDQHSQMQLALDGPKDKTFTFISLKNKSIFGSLVNKEKSATVEALNKRGVPNIEFRLGSLTEESIGSLFLIFELTTIMLAKKLKINPF